MKTIHSLKALGAVGAVTLMTTSLSMTPSAFAQCDPVEIEQLLASDGSLQDVFGFTVALSGDVAVVGADQDDPNGGDSGSAYVYRWDGSSWVEEQKLTPDDAHYGDHFGWCVDIDGDVIVIGTPGHADNGPFSGSVYFYHWDGSTWTQTQKVNADDAQPEDRFGYAVVLDGNVCLIGAPTSDGGAFKSGAAYAFRFDGSTWNQEQKLVPPDPSVMAAFGVSVDVDENQNRTLIGSGSDDDNGMASGSAYVYRHNGSNWLLEQKLLPDDGAEDDWFGYSVSISGSAALIGAYRDDDNGPDSGSVYVFRRSGSVWSQEQELLATDGVAGDLFGRSVAVLDNIALIGADNNSAQGNQSGAAYLYRWDGSTWLDDTKLVPAVSDAGDNCGSSVALTSQYAALGAPFQGTQGNELGSVFLYDHNCPGFNYTLAIEGVCPGSVTLTWDGATPDRQQAIVFGRRLGSTIIPEGNPCAGTILGVTGDVQMVDPPGFFSTGSGSGTLNGTVNATTACGKYLQLVEGGSCITSTVAQIPSQ